MVDVWRVKSRWNFEFVKVVADKVTASSVFINGNRVSKASDGVRYFEDFSSAKEYATGLLRRTIDESRKSMEKAEEMLSKFNHATEETVPESKSRW